MEKLKSRIINTEITNFKNKTTGELNVMTKITYTYPCANSEISCDHNILTCYFTKKLHKDLKTNKLVKNK